MPMDLLASTSHPVVHHVVHRAGHCVLSAGNVNIIWPCLLSSTGVVNNRLTGRLSLFISGFGDVGCALAKFQSPEFAKVTK